MPSPHRDGKQYPQFVNQEGARVTVDGYTCQGTLRYYGPHHAKAGQRCGVELDEPVGKNNGTIDGHTYFTCEAEHGVLVSCRWTRTTMGKGLMVSRHGGSVRLVLSLTSSRRPFIAQCSPVKVTIVTPVNTSPAAAAPAPRRAATSGEFDL